MSTTIDQFQNWRRSYDDGDLTPTNEIMEAKNETSPGGTLPRQQRQTKRSLSSKIDLPTPLQLFNTDYTAEARKQMSMYYSTPSPSTDSSIFRKQTGPPNDNEMCQKVEKCFIDGPAVHYRTNLQTSHFQPSYNQHQMIYGGNLGKVYAGQFQTQAEVHVEHSQIEVCMVNFEL